MRAFQIIPFGWYFKKAPLYHRRDGGFDKIGGGWNLLGATCGRAAFRDFW